ncbi:MAG: radical SAM protein [Bacteroidales bacterium]|nr:radical SAM protein [Bacteroidales bacterium]
MENGIANRELIPILSDSAVFRRESWGGILFFSPLSLEEHLGLKEAFVISLCDGMHTISTIESLLKEKFGLSQEDSEATVSGVIRKAIHAGAVELIGFPKKEAKRKIWDKILQVPCTLNAPKSVMWYITQKCNLRCQHCFLEGCPKASHEFSEEDAKRLMDELGRMGVLYLSLSGGEPFMRKDLFRLIEYASSYGMRVDIASNGTLIDKDMVKKIASSHVFQVQVSIDGLEKVHNSFRANNEAFKASAEAVRRMLDEGIMVTISHTVRKGLVGEAEKVIDWAVGMQCAGIKIIPFYPVGRGEKKAAQYVLTKEDIVQLHGMISEKRKLAPAGFEIYTEMDYLIPLKGLTEQSRFMFCPAGKETLAVFPDGTLYACPFLTTFPAGKWPEDTIENVWFHSPVLSMLRGITAAQVAGKCRECENRTICGGGCRAFAYYSGSAIDGSDPYCLVFAGK